MDEEKMHLIFREIGVVLLSHAASPEETQYISGVMLSAASRASSYSVDDFEDILSMLLKDYKRINDKDG